MPATNVHHAMDRLKVSSLLFSVSSGLPPTVVCCPCSINTFLNSYNSCIVHFSSSSLYLSKLCCIFQCLSAIRLPTFPSVFFLSFNLHSPRIWLRCWQWQIPFITTLRLCTKLCLHDVYLLGPLCDNNSSKMNFLDSTSFCSPAHAAAFIVRQVFSCSLSQWVVTSSVNQQNDFQQLPNTCTSPLLWGHHVFPRFCIQHHVYKHSHHQELKWVIWTVAHSICFHAKPSQQHNLSAIKPGNKQLTAPLTPFKPLL